MSNYKDRVCRACGKTFLGGARAWYCPDCRYERRKERDRLIKRNGPNRKLGSTDYCEICGKPYIVNSGLQRYCPKCVPEKYAETARKQSLEWYGKNKEEINPRRYEKRSVAPSEIICSVCGKKFLGYKNQKVCGEECRKEYMRRYSQEYERAHPGRKKKNKEAPAQADPQDANDA